MRRSRSLNRRKKSHVTPREVGARDWPRLSGGSERGKLWVPMESRPACGRTSPGSWPRNYYVSLTDACLGANSPFCGKRHGWSRCRSQDALRTSLPPIGRSAFWAELASYWREWWRSLSSRICPGVFLDCTTASLASGGDGLRPTLQPVSASWLRGPSSAVTWSWLCRWTWSTPSTASPWTGYTGPSGFLGYPRICEVWSGHFSRTEASSTPSLAGGCLRGRCTAGLRRVSCCVRCCGTSRNTQCFECRCLRNRHWHATPTTCWCWSGARRGAEPSI